MENHWKNFTKERILFMYQQTNYYQPYSTRQGLKGRPVSSIEEARCASIDFDGSTFFFPDLANQRIYTKQINMDGTSSFNMYQLTEMPPQFDSNRFVTREEFEAVIRSLTQPRQAVATPAPQSTQPAPAQPQAVSPEANQMAQRF